MPGTRAVLRAALLLALSLLMVRAEAGLQDTVRVSSIPMSTDAEAAVATQLLSALTWASNELNTGRADDFVAAYEAPVGAADVDVERIATKVIAASLVSRCCHASTLIAGEQTSTSKHYKQICARQR